MDIISNKLPIELLVEVLRFLDFRGLIACKQVCKLFHDLIRETAALQYTIEIIASAQSDGPNNLISPATRLQMLRNHQSAWHDVRWALDKRIGMLRGGLWELYGGVLAQSNRAGDLVFDQLPSTLRCIEEKHWVINTDNLGFRIRDFGMDTSQDLLVLIENPRWSGPHLDHTYRFHLHTLSTGERHPLAPDNNPFLSHQQELETTQVSYSIQISGDYIGVLFHNVFPGENEFLIWHWKTNEVQMNLTGDEIRSFSFLSGNFVVMSLLTMSESLEGIEPSLFVLDFNLESKERQAVDEVEHAILLRYPSLRADLIAFDIRSDPSPTYTATATPEAPFYTSHKARLFVVSMLVQVGPHVQSITNFVPWVVLQSYVDLSLSGKLGNVIEWDEWGFETRMLLPDEMHSSVWVCYVYGSRYVVAAKPSASSNRPPCGYVYDFNQYMLAFGTGITEVADVSASDIPIGETFYVTGENIIPAGEIFDEEVRTYCPYRLRAFPLERSTDRTALMCSEDSIVVVNVRHQAIFQAQGLIRK